MTVMHTHQGCKVETTHVIQPNNTYRTEIVLSVDPGSALALDVEERASVNFEPSTAAPKSSMRVRATRHGFELVQR